MNEEIQQLTSLISGLQGICKEQNMQIQILNRKIERLEKKVEQLSTTQALF